MSASLNAGSPYARRNSFYLMKPSNKGTHGGLLMYLVKLSPRIPGVASQQQQPLQKSVSRSVPNESSLKSARSQRGKWQGGLEAKTG